MSKPRVIVGMSGGLDSSVAAALLVEQGYDVVGITIKTYRYEDVGGNVGSDTSCCSLDGINDARRVAIRLGIPHYVYDFTERFGEEIIDYFVDAYLAGDTPNPCVMCNRKIKWAEMLRRADSLGADFVATGHYARIRRDQESGRYILSRGLDASKDQSYALWAVAQESLARTIFPLADLTKPESRAIAARLDLPVAGKQESYEICFIPDNDYTRFLRDNVPGLDERVKGGDIVQDGRVIGQHAGFPFYTVGQRRGLGISSPDPLYVINIDASTNTVEVGGNDQLMHRGLRASNVNLIKYASIDEPLRVTAKIRYKDEGAPATCRTLPDGTLDLLFDEPRRAITRGQSVVLYEGDDVVGGGVITEWRDGTP
ncbi:MAG TPA: tRNA 2-thiouridine(34) synthase MnmA [Candidatus Kapabacteria bacterium]|nr:tRNA 2-thiouridine(34) synthase MnmA [Candidatus Kapabacteria bacterium]